MLALRWSSGGWWGLPDQWRSVLELVWAVSRHSLVFPRPKEEVTVKKEKRERERDRQREWHGRGRGRPEVIQSHSIFEQGPAELMKKRGNEAGAEGWGASNGPQCGLSRRRPVQWTRPAARVSTQAVSPRLTCSHRMG